MTSSTDATENQSKGRDLRDFVRMIRRYWLGAAIIVLATIGLVAGGTIQAIGAAGSISVGVCRESDVL